MLSTSAATGTVETTAGERAGGGAASAARVLAGMDIGTNSIRLGLWRIEPEGDTALLSQQKEVVRLGEGEFPANRLTAEAMERALLVGERFAEVARGWGAERIIALATSAVREAENGGDFVAEARRRADLQIRVISGREEARLIYLGVRSGADLTQPALIIDIGGGSTEIIVGDHEGEQALESVKLGAIRLTNQLVRKPEKPVPPETFAQLKQHVLGVASPALRRVLPHRFVDAYGCSGTIMNLAEIVARRKGDERASLRNYAVTPAEIAEVAAYLCRLPLEERRRVPGINPERADIIIGGAAILTALLDATRPARLLISEQALREGILADYLLQDEAGQLPQKGSVRRRSVFQLARACRYEADHALTVTRLALSLFDQLRLLGLHEMGAGPREVLEYAGILHDIGGFISYTDHHKHSYYIIRHAALLGFDAVEQEMVAAVALHHRKALPKRPADGLLTRKQWENVRGLSTLLRLAESMDRSHLQLVEEAEVRREADGAVRLRLQCAGECDLELWRLAEHARVFEEVFGVPLRVG